MIGLSLAKIGGLPRQVLRVIDADESRTTANLPRAIFS